MSAPKLTTVENVWLQLPGLDEDLPEHIMCRVIIELSVPTRIKGELTRFKFKVHAMLSKRSDPAFLIYPKTMSLGNSLQPLFEPDEGFDRWLNAVARGAYKHALKDAEGELKIGTRYKVKNEGGKTKVVHESRPGV